MCNFASPEHPVVQEIVRRRREGLSGNSGHRAKLGLVVEGGGMRGVYSGGALVAMEELGLGRVFDEVYGESAGAINSCYFLAGQGAFGIRIYLEDLRSLKFVNPLRIGRMLDVEYAIDVVVRRVKPLNVASVLSSPSDLYIGVTHAMTGQSRMISVKRDGIPLLTLLKATGAIVPLYNHAVMIEGEPYVDGGISNPIPIQAAIDAGCMHILVILTRPSHFISTNFKNFQRLCVSMMLSKWPAAFVETFHQRQSNLYNETRSIALGTTVVKQGVKIAVIAPTPDSPPIERATVGRRKLLAARNDATSITKEIFRDLDGD
jgi:predicted patatin/cPLA2 family phospholipase